MAADLPEAVDVELAHKGAEVGVLEVVGQDGRGELDRVPHHKRLLVVLVAPRDLCVCAVRVHSECR